MIARVREENINTPAYWNLAWELEPPWQFGFGIHQDRCETLTADLEPPADVLDVGGGRGEFLRWLGSTYNRTLFDHSSFGVQTAVENGWADQGLVGDARDLSFHDDEFDATFCGELLEHVEFPYVLVGELRRVTKPGGIVGITTPLLNTQDDVQHVWSFSEDDIRGLMDWADPKITIVSGPTIVAVTRA